jgi:hypothetical protein
MEDIEKKMVIIFFCGVCMLEGGYIIYMLKKCLNEELIQCKFDIVLDAM